MRRRMRFLREDNTHADTRFAGRGLGITHRSKQGASRHADDISRAYIPASGCRRRDAYMASAPAMPVKSAGGARRAGRGRRWRARRYADAAFHFGRREAAAASSADDDARAADAAKCRHARSREARRGSILLFAPAAARLMPMPIPCRASPRRASRSKEERAGARPAAYDPEHDIAAPRSYTDGLTFIWAFCAAYTYAGRPMISADASRGAGTAPGLQASYRL